MVGSWQLYPPLRAERLVGIPRGCDDVRLARGVSSSLCYAACDCRCGGGCCSRFATVKSFVSSTMSRVYNDVADTSSCFVCSDGYTVSLRVSSGWQGGGGSCDKACRNYLALASASLWTYCWGGSSASFVVLRPRLEFTRMMHKYQLL